MPNIWLTLLCPTTLEEKLIDHLLVNMGSQVFMSTSIAAHGLATDSMSSMEQVMGRTRAIQIQLVVGMQQLPELLDSLHENFPQTGLRYWTSQITQQGELK
ncbi:DUF3240 family protein [Pseudomonas aeruginosa]